MRSFLQKIEYGPVRAARPDDVAEAADEPIEAEALGEGRDHRLAGELAGPVERDGQVPEVLLAARLRHVAVDGPARGQDELRDAVQSSCFERVVRRDCALLEVESRALESPARLGVCGQVEHDLVLAHGMGERVQITGIALHELRPPARERALDELRLADAQVVEHGDRPARDQELDEMAPDEPRSTDDHRAHEFTFSARRRRTSSAEEA